MTKLTYEFYLLFIIKGKMFDVIKMQTSNILIYEDDQFVNLKENELQKAKKTYKNREKPIKPNFIKFNDKII